ncbi:MAG: glycosyltransferase, partial [Alphaproteobacteria bacterium]|nr:glycosyltransferase [Alphaproteobacteria bacterium]
KDSRIKVLSQENSGQAIARNLATNEATGTFIQYVDADDYLDPNACELLYTYARFFSLDMLSFSGIEFNHKTREEFEDAYHTLSWLPSKFSSVFMWNMVGTDMPKLSVTACLTIYRRMHLLKNKIEWMNQKMAFEDTPYFIESAFRNARIGTLKLPLYHRRVHGAATTQRMDVHFNDLIFMYKHTLKMLKDMGVPYNIILSYAELFFQKVYLNYIYLEKSVKENEDKNFFDFCLYMRKKYHLQYTQNLQHWIQARLKDNDLKEKIAYKFYGLLSKSHKDKFTIPLFEYQKAPYFAIKLFDLPIIEVQTNKKGLYSMTCKICGVQVLSIREI